MFLSYAREDAAAAGRIADALRGFGVEVWFDQNELRGGEAWDEKIRMQIRSCVLFVPVISASTQARREGYFRREWKLAVERTHDMAEGAPFFAPVAIDDTAESRALVPAEFMRVQWTRLPGGLPTPPFIEQIKRLLAQTRAPVAEVARVSRPVGLDITGQETRATSRRRVPVWIWAVPAVCVVAAVAFFATRKSAPPADKSVAVLPFVNLGADKADEYLGDGMTEELLNALAKVKGLRVPGRTSSFTFKGRTGDDIFRQVGEKLRVSTVLEGSVRKTGNRVRITTQLINVADGFHLWSETYDRDLTDLLAIQTEVAQQVVQKLQVALGVEEARALAQRPTENAEAHRLYLLGRFHFAKVTETGWTSAEQYFNDALRLDPSYALAYCGLADNYGWLGGSFLSGREAWTKGKEAAQKALALDPHLAEAHYSLSAVLAYEFDWPGIEREVKRALELNPKLTLAQDELGWLCALSRRFDEAVANAKKAIELDPLSPVVSVDLGFWLYYARRYDDAIAQARRVLELDPNFPMGHNLLGWSLLRKGDTAGAIAEFQKVQSLDPAPFWESNVGYAYARAGDRAKAEQSLRTLEEAAKRRYISPSNFMGIYLELGEKDRAFEWLEKCYEDRDGVCFMMKIEPAFDPVRDDPRFKAMLKKVRLDQ